MPTKARSKSKTIQKRSNKNLKRYRLTLLLIVSFLLIVITALSWLLYSRGPRVRSVDFAKPPSEISFTSGDVLTVNFDRPLQNADYSGQISFEPKVNFAAKTQNQSVAITLRDNLQHNTAYIINIGPDIFDSSGKKMQESHEYVFSTAQPSYVYLERNYGIDSENYFQDKDDYIKLGQIGEPTETIFSHPKIIKFSASDKYIVAAVREDQTDALYIVDRKTNKTTRTELPIAGQISKLELGIRGTVALLTVMPDFNSVEPEYFKEHSNSLFSLNINSGEIQNILDSNGEQFKAYSIHTETYSQFALIQDGNLSYHIVSPFNDFEPVLIGLHTDTFGFNELSSEIIFRDNSKFSVYNVGSGSLEDLILDNDANIRDLTSINDQLFALSSVYSVDGYNDYIETINAAGKTRLWTSDSDDETIQNFTPSYDASLLSIQLGSINCDYDDLSPNSQCSDANTIIYDTKSKSIIEHINGFDLIWLP